MSRTRNVTLRRLRRFFLRHISEQAFAVAKFVEARVPKSNVAYDDTPEMEFVQLLIPYRHRPHRQAFGVTFMAEYVTVWRVGSADVEVTYGEPELFERLERVVGEYLRG